LVGDAKQLQPIEAGGPFNAIIQRLGDAAMSTIIRQTEEWQRNMVEAFSKGEAGKALRELDKRGALHIAEDRKQAQEDLVKHWRTTGLADPENTLVLTGTNKDANLLNREIQAMRLAEGQLGSDYVSNEHARFRENDRVVFTKNSGPRGVRNGNLGTVEEVNEAENSLRIRGDNGRLVEISLSDYDHLKLAYCVTTHKSQGMTCNGTVYVLTDEGMQDRSLSYVQASRSRVSTQIFSTKEEAGADLALLSKKMSRERLKRMASDLKPEVSDQRHEPEKPQISQGLEISL
jgi:ATP-dependent exoDNAse (exonuclease V) alpha subunit